jgi:hypothetical protein
MQARVIHETGGLAPVRSVIHISMPRLMVERAVWYGELLHHHSLLPDSHCTPAADPEHNIRSHIRGKYGELAFLAWALAAGLPPSHTPFRADYTRRCADDDFVIHGRRIEVKTKKRGAASPWPPPEHYGANLGVSGLDNALYVFVEIAPGSCVPGMGPECALLGWADRELIEARGQRVQPGSVSANGNFTYRRHDWHIPIGVLQTVESLAEALGAVPVVARAA